MGLKDPLVSIVVPHYNQSKYLPACLDSIMFQKYEDIEIIIVNDGSTDDADEVIDGYIRSLRTDTANYVAGFRGNKIIRKTIRRYSRRKRIKVIRHGVNKGATAAFNTGCKAARGEFVTYIGSDDLAHPLMISEMVDALKTKRVDFVYSDMWIVNDDGRILREFKLPDYDFHDVFCRWYFAGVSKLFKRRLFEKFGYFDYKYKLAMDYDLFSRFAMGGARFYHIPKTLFSVRAHDSPDRKVGQHEPANRALLFKESIEIALRNIAWYKSQRRTK